MKKYLVIICLTYFTQGAYTQDHTHETETPAKPFKPVFKKGYIRLGISAPGKIDNTISPLENLGKGNYGSESGYHIEFGHIFYFLNRREPRLVNVGLDWTILGLGFTPTNGWKEYTKLDPTSVFIDGTYALTGISKLGPVVAFNPTERLVLEARGQLTYGFKLATDMGFKGEDYYYTFQEDGFIGGTGLGNSFGATVRYGVFGFSVDYEQVKTPLSIAMKEKGSTDDITTSEKILFKSLVVKLNFSF